MSICITYGVLFSSSLIKLYLNGPFPTMSDFIVCLLNIDIGIYCSQLKPFFFS